MSLSKGHAVWRSRRTREKVNYKRRGCQMRIISPVVNFTMATSSVTSYGYNTEELFHSNPLSKDMGFVKEVLLISEQLTAEWMPHTLRWYGYAINGSVLHPRQCLIVVGDGQSQKAYEMVRAVSLNTSCIDDVELWDDVVLVATINRDTKDEFWSEDEDCSSTGYSDEYDSEESQ